jgi:hypothetical protein
VIDADQLKAAMDAVAKRYSSDSNERSYLRGIVLRPKILGQIIEELRFKQ